MTSSEWPILSSLRNARSSLATSSKCRPVVGSSNRNSLPRIDGVSSAAASASSPASFSRCASPPDSVGTGWPSFTYSSPTSTSGCSRTATLRIAAEERQRLGDRHVEHLRDVLARAVRAFAPDLERLGAITLAVAVRAAQVHVRQELHLHVLEAVAAAGRAAAGAGIEAERARRVLARPRRRFVREQLAHHVERADVTRGIRARGAADRALVDHHHVVDQLRALEPVERARRLARLALRLAQRLVQHVFDERGLARARHAGDAHQPPQREFHVDVLEVVLRDAAQLDRLLRRHHACPWLRCRPGFAARRRARRDDFRARQILPGQRRRIGAHRLGRVERHDLAAALAGAGTQVQQPVRREHDLRIVLDHHQRIAGIAQPVHHLRHALHVARMQADRRLIEHEQRVHQRRAQRRRQVDPLDLAARQRARLAIEREIAESHFAQIGEARAHLAQQQVRRFIERRGQLQRLEELRGSCRATAARGRARCGRRCATAARRA